MVTQRGHNGELLVRDDHDRNHWRAVLAEQVRRYRLALHGYVLLDQAFHLVITPGDAEALPSTLQALGRAYVRYFNNRHARTGTLWDGRYKCTVVQADKYLLPCLVWLDRLPILAAQVKDPSEYVWGSHRGLTGQAPDGLLTPHAQYWALGNTPFAREAAYAEMVRVGLGRREEAELIQAANRPWALGDARFVAEIQALTARRVSPLQPGRPRKGRV